MKTENRVAEPYKEVADNKTSENAADKKTSDFVLNDYMTPNRAIYYHHTKADIGIKPTAGRYERHSCLEMLYLIEGELEYVVEGETYAVNVGELILVSADEIHYLKINPKKPYERIVVQLDLNLLTDLFPSDINVFSFLLFNDFRVRRVIPKNLVDKYKVSAILNEIVAEPKEDEFFYDNLMARALLLAANLTKILKEKVTETIKPIKINEFIKNTVAYINAHISEELSLEKIAHDLYVSKSHLSHAFKKKMNISVNNYIITKKIHLANKLIASGMSPVEAAMKVGYNYYTTFFYNFKTVMGRVPSSSAKKNYKPDF